MSIVEKITSFDPKTYKIFVGVIAALGGIDTFVNAEMWAESAWGAEISPESKNIAETYEKIWGLFLLPLAGLCITAALVLDEKNRAVMAFYSGLVMLAFFGLFFSVMQTLDYKSPALPFMLMPIVIVSLLIYSGYKHKDN